MTDHALPTTHEETFPPRRATPARRFRAWLGRKLIDRLRWTDGPVHVAYHPDAAYELQQLPEFRALYESWIAGNRRGNGGDLTRLYSFILNIKHCLADGVAGNFAELGVWRGNSAAVLAHFAAQNDRHVYLFDTFAGFDARDLHGVDKDREAQFKETSLDMVRRTVGNDAHRSVRADQGGAGVLLSAHVTRRHHVRPRLRLRDLARCHSGDGRTARGNGRIARAAPRQVGHRDHSEERGTRGEELGGRR